MPLDQHGSPQTTGECSQITGDCNQTPLTPLRTIKQTGNECKATIGNESIHQAGDCVS